jgi:hypothetical protein
MLDPSTSDTVPLERPLPHRNDMQVVASVAECDDLKLIVISDHEESRVLVSCDEDFEPGQLIDFCREHLPSPTLPSIQMSETSSQLT